MKWLRRGRSSTDRAAAPAVTTPAPAAGPPEHAVLVRFAGVTRPDVGLAELEDPLIAAIERAGVGELDGNDVGPDGATLYLYGPDADALFAAVEGELRRAPLAPGAHAIKRYGPPGSEAVRVELA